MMFPAPLVSADLLANPLADKSARYDAKLRASLNLAAGLQARQTIAQWPGYQASPLRSLDAMAQQLGLASILYKDESSRFGLGSFKALGGAYAVYRLLCHAVRQRHRDVEPSYADLAAGRYQAVVGAMTVCCATDGNHGRSVAWGAHNFGAACVIYLHAGVSQAREDAIAAYGARIVRTAGNYDDAVRQAAADAQAHGWTVVSDTSYAGYTDIPADVMQGYSVMLVEAQEQGLASEPPTHVLVQGGVGGLAAAVCAHLWECHGAARPTVVVVEPEQADCLRASAQAGEPVTVSGSLDTVMAGLACGEVSLLAWQVLRQGGDFFITIPDDSALRTMRLLAAPAQGSIICGESGAAGLAGLLAVCGSAEARARIGLDASSRVLVIGTEGDTDAALYAQVVGARAQDVLAARTAHGF
jgi:diaminopropionate ammonia-lyase